MTSRERAEKIFQILVVKFSSIYGDVIVDTSVKDDLAAQIEEAEREVEKELIKHSAGKHLPFNCYCVGKEKYVAELCRGCHCRIGSEWEAETIKNLKDKTYAEGFRAAREKAKGIVKSWTTWTPEHVEKLAQRIGEMEP